MQLINQDSAVRSINVGGAEYSGDADGVVTITDPVHIAAAQAHGFIEHDGIPVLDQPHEAGE